MRNTIFMFLQTIIGLHLCSGCIQSERDALLKVKQDLTDPSNRLASWVEDGDCCSWYGVICHNITGHVLELHLRSLSFEKSAFGGKVSESLVELKHLEYLDLSNSNFGGIPIPKFLGSVRRLRVLDFSYAGFGGMIPSQLANLSNLQYLNLYSRYYYDEAYAENLQWITGMPSLTFLDLSNVNLSQASDWLNVINTLPSLVELHLEDCSLPNVVVSALPTVNFSSLSILDLSLNNDLSTLDFVQNLTSLKVLDFSDNDLHSSVPNWIYSFSHLEHLNLHNNNLQGKIPSDIGNLTSLVALDLGRNNLDGKIPKSFKKLCNLKSIGFRKNKLGQEINDIFEILFPCISNVLEDLDLADCHLSGYIPNHLEKFKNLDTLFLSNNFISGPIPISIGNLKSIEYIYFSLNKLNGTLPESFGGLSKLESLYLSHNALEGDISEIHFENLTNLEEFYASGNKLRLKVNPDWNPPRNLSSLDLADWSIGPQFPNWIESLNFLSYLNLANSGIASPIPTWFWNMSSNFYSLNISHNQIYGVIPHIPSSKTHLSIVDLSSNNFEGPLPSIFSYLEGLYLSNNLFTGPLSTFLCHNMHEPRFLVLDIGDNLFSEEIPDCWIQFKRLEFMNLDNNKLSGKIPWSIGALTNLKSLHLRNNSLSGEIPLSLGNCTELNTIDLSENELVGNIPSWIGETLLNMMFLSLRTNKFDGHVPEKLCGMISLRILDLSDNKLLVDIPKCLYNFSAMMKENNSIDMATSFSYYEIGDYEWSFFDSMSLVTKGKLNTYDRLLRFVRAIDLSKNKLSGQIPEDITSLKMLRYLNLSHNLLTGRIPKDVGAMQSLEALDLSQNQLFGEIPQSLAGMTFLNLLNLSFNNLSGRIPLSTQIQGFSPSSFMGNEKLCGPPLTKSCKGDGEAPSPNIEGEKGNDDDGHEIVWFYGTIALGFVVGFWVTFGPLVFNRRWRGLYFHFLENLWDKIWIWWHFL